MLSTKILAIIAAFAAAAALSASGGLAAAALPVQRLGTVTQIHPVHTISAPRLAKEAGSAGVPGYSDVTCEGLLKDFEKSVDEVEQGTITGDDHRADYYGNIAKHIYGQLTNNCLLVD